MKSRVLFIIGLLMLLPLTMFAMQVEPEATPQVIETLNWVTFLTPVIVWLATLVAKLVLKIGGVAVIVVVASLSSITGFIMQAAGQTDNWIIVALLGLASVFIAELGKKLTETPASKLAKAEATIKELK